MVDVGSEIILCSPLGEGEGVKTCANFDMMWIWPLDCEAREGKGSPV
jgi:hypothetical protein